MVLCPTLAHCHKSPVALYPKISPLFSRVLREPLSHAQCPLWDPYAWGFQCSSHWSSPNPPWRARLGQAEAGLGVATLQASPTSGRWPWRSPWAYTSFAVLEQQIRPLKAGLWGVTVAMAQPVLRRGWYPRPQLPTGTKPRKEKCFVNPP